MCARLFLLQSKMDHKKIISALDDSIFSTFIIVVNQNSVQHINERDQYHMKIGRVCVMAWSFAVEKMDSISVGVNDDR